MRRTSEKIREYNCDCARRRFFGTGGGVPYFLFHLNVETLCRASDADRGLIRRANRRSLPRRRRHACPYRKSAGTINLSPTLIFRLTHLFCGLLSSNLRGSIYPPSTIEATTEVMTTTATTTQHHQHHQRRHDTSTTTTSDRPAPLTRVASSPSCSAGHRGDGAAGRPDHGGDDVSSLGHEPLLAPPEGGPGYVTTTVVSAHQNRHLQEALALGLPGYSSGQNKVHEMENMLVVTAVVMVVTVKVVAVVGAVEATVAEVV